MDINELTIGQAKELAALFSEHATSEGLANPYIGQRVLVRTYSAGVHIGTLKSAHGRECGLVDALRLWKWEGGGLSLSAVATDGIKGGRLNKTPSVFLTEAIEFIPVTDEAWKSYERFVE
jgi:hypothetical protein